jgi:hypothetical protein
MPAITRPQAKVRASSVLECNNCHVKDKYLDSLRACCITTGSCVHNKVTCCYMHHQRLPAAARIQLSAAADLNCISVSTRGTCRQRHDGRVLPTGLGMVLCLLAFPFNIDDGALQSDGAKGSLWLQGGVKRLHNTIRRSIYAIYSGADAMCLRV